MVLASRPVCPQGAKVHVSFSVSLGDFFCQLQWRNVTKREKERGRAAREAKGDGRASVEDGV